MLAVSETRALDHEGGYAPCPGLGIRLGQHDGPVRHVGERN
jgi:hypothetical protein